MRTGQERRGERMRRLSRMWEEEKGEGRREKEKERQEGEKGFDGGYKIEIKLLQIFLLKTSNYDN